MSRKRRQPRLLKCTVLNPPETPEEQEVFSRRSCKALATAIYRNFEPEEVNRIIEILRKERESSLRKEVEN